MKTFNIPSDNCNCMEIHTCALEVEFHNSYNEYLLSLTEMENVSPRSNCTSAHENISFHTEVLTKGKLEE